MFVVKLTFKEGTRDAWLAGWKHLADYCIANEPNTLSVGIPRISLISRGKDDGISILSFPLPTILSLGYRVMG